MKKLILIKVSVVILLFGLNSSSLFSEEISEEMMEAKKLIRGQASKLELTSCCFFLLIKYETGIFLQRNQFIFCIISYNCRLQKKYGYKD